MEKFEQQLMEWYRLYPIKQPNDELTFIHTPILWNDRWVIARVTKTCIQLSDRYGIEQYGSKEYCQKACDEHNKKYGFNPEFIQYVKLRALDLI